MKKHFETQRHPAWAFLLTLLLGVIVWLTVASLVRGIQSVAAAEPASGAGAAISFTPSPAVAQKSEAALGGQKAEPLKPAGKQSKGAREEKPGFVEKFTPADESAVQEFLAANHPELGRVLGALKLKHTREYARAIQDLSLTQSRLEQLRRQDLAKYERELAAWQVKSRIQLLVARIKMNPRDVGLKAELKQEVVRQIAQQREQLAAERDRLRQRLEKVDAQLERLSGESSALVEQRMSQWLTSADGDHRGVSAPKKQKNAANLVKEEDSSQENTNQANRLGREHNGPQKPGNKAASNAGEKAKP